MLVRAVEYRVPICVSQGGADVFNTIARGGVHISKVPHLCRPGVELFQNVAIHEGYGHVHLPKYFCNWSSFVCLRDFVWAGSIMILAMFEIVGALLLIVTAPDFAHVTTKFVVLAFRVRYVWFEKPVMLDTFLQLGCTHLMEVRILHSGFVMDGHYGHCVFWLFLLNSANAVQQSMQLLRCAGWCYLKVSRRRQCLPDKLHDNFVQFGHGAPGTVCVDKCLCANLFAPGQFPRSCPIFVQ